MKTGFYGFPKTHKRKASWSLLSQINLNSDLPWCVLGDFNKILTQDEKLGGNRRPHKQMVEFKVALEKNGLFDVRWRNQKYTWSNRHQDSTFTKEKLERVVVNQLWGEEFSFQ